jgi:TonB family protein
MQCLENRNPVFESTLVELNTETSFDPALFAPLPGAQESANCQRAIRHDAPKAVYTPDPISPRRDFDPRNTVLLWLLIGADGIPRGLKVVRSFDPSFGDAAIKAVQNWRFQPGTCDGQPTATEATVEVVFHR